jgi:hypothetical protein
MDLENSENKKNRNAPSPPCFWPEGPARQPMWTRAAPPSSLLCLTNETTPRLLLADRWDPPVRSIPFLGPVSTHIRHGQASARTSRSVDWATALTEPRLPGLAHLAPSRDPFSVRAPSHDHHGRHAKLETWSLLSLHPLLCSLQWLEDSRS